MERAVHDRGGWPTDAPIESMPPEAYERASYYERWLVSVESVLTEKGVLVAGELDRRVGS